MFAEAEVLYLDMRYDEAITLLKQHLIRNPKDAGAHFYLGTCYLNSPKNGWLGIAQGELQTALALFKEQGKVNPIPRFNNATYFEMICHINLAKVYLRLIVNVLDLPQNQLGVDRGSAIEKLVEGLEEQYAAAREIAPNDPDVKALYERISEVKGLLRYRPRSNPSRPDNNVSRTTFVRPSLATHRKAA
ncbi:MAG: hypothetical protein K1Y02_07460 [Candidatus Hydrogenedentes bacterium]|nr:hypothetical protein [Candidatus Hydrogenedentota bacterium]